MFEYISSRVAHLLENKPGCYPQQLGSFCFVSFFTAPFQNGTSPAASCGIKKRLLPDFRLENATMRPCIVVIKQVNSYIGSHVGLYAVTNSSSHVTFTMTSCAHCHTIIQIQSYTYKHAMVLHNGKRTRARNLNRYLHRNPPEADQVSAPEPSGTATGIYIGTFRNLTRYLNQHDLIQRQSCWMTRCY